MARTPNSKYTEAEKIKIVESLKKDFSTKNFKAVSEQFGCSLMSIRAWARKEGDYKPRIQKNSKLTVSTESASKAITPVEEIREKVAMISEIENIRIEIDENEQKLVKIQQKIEAKVKLYEEKTESLKKNFGIEL